MWDARAQRGWLGSFLLSTQSVATPLETPTKVPSFPWWGSLLTSQGDSPMKKTLIAAALAAAALLTPSCSLMSHQVYTDCTVQAKDTLLDGNGDGGVTRTKRVTTTCGAFDVEDSLAGGFNSWDLWTALEVGKTYDIETGGPRVGFFSMFPYVTKVTAK
ncbi:secreted protein [Mycobacterium phage Phrux]|uniref:secreted protein n=1 Tax=Mycobacterium phage Phrux TaxID=1327774 RepID=UPI00032B3471|nr:secreted protein [Mycobacterium phage Phrux]YP_008409458.1 secreted protein [Mycobacterium phage DrDrey]YP_008410079.1 secreted protein [Mycobacterium phage Contagion]AXH68537.1 hypothetical protein SEA_XKCD_68 [Mycobacterium phage xkcd]AGK87757.1 hypothetical protein PBI_PHRUX_62 [Mycobacterium phage Phrux]AGT13193.1 hypothetical protein PBI_CONTAGION_61 [Mycobacterium phage Contagion]AGT13736.1 hypothetical protein DRDREY_65 [Mycobacterium phage DrDrey]